MVTRVTGLHLLTMRAFEGACLRSGLARTTCRARLRLINGDNNAKVSDLFEASTGVLCEGPDDSVGEFMTLLVRHEVLARDTALEVLKSLPGAGATCTRYFDVDIYTCLHAYELQSR